MNRAGQGRAIDLTRRWLERFVIGLGLCPFAAKPFRLERIAYRVCDDTSLEDIYRSFLGALEALILADPQEQETALLILSRGLPDFDGYLDGLAMLEQAVEDAGLGGVIQVASFHPDYCFEGVSREDPANFTNRSPLPMFHLIREAGLAAALESYPDPEMIPERNVRRLRELGVRGIRDLIDKD
ncbi:MAG: DUF1415 domain-containing protein [Sedimenticolaceae bacterium]